MRRLIACVLIAVFFALVGPRIVGPQSHSAGTPFVYEPPDGFVLMKNDQLGPGTENAQVWIVEEPKSFDGSPPPKEQIGNVTRVIANHSTTEMSVEEADLAKLAAEMPKAFEDAHCTWVHRRHEMRTRSDGARVGLIEGDCDREVDLSALGLKSQSVKSRKLQLMFPDDKGTSIVTASYPTDKASRFEPLFEATIGKAKGVATRAPMPPPWTFAAWGAAGLVLGWLATALLARRAATAPTTTPPPPSPSPAP